MSQKPVQYLKNHGGKEKYLTTVAAHSVPGVAEHRIAKSPDHQQIRAS
ncbi:MAG: hypothetical protein ABI091_21670 [Ferruginibacter sp.]